jgi:hypothetical protein
MTKFIKFTNGIINTAFIRHVEIDKPAKKFIIHLNSSHNSGLFFLGTGYFCNEFNRVLISNEKYPEGVFRMINLHGSLSLNKFRQLLAKYQ